MLVVGGAVTAPYMVVESGIARALRSSCRRGDRRRLRRLRSRLSFALGCVLRGKDDARVGAQQSGSRGVLPLQDAFAVLFCVSAGNAVRPDVLVRAACRCSRIGDHHLGKTLIATDVLAYAIR